MERILFVHGLASSGAYKLANTLRMLLKPASVLAPDFPIDPDAALSQLRALCRAEQPDLVVGLSWGAFLTQQLRGRKKVLINPSFRTSEVLRSLIGEVSYLSPRAGGETSFTVSPALCARYQALEAEQFAGIDAAEQALTLGFFALQDERVRHGPLFETYYPGRAVYYPGTHLPTYPEVKTFLLPELLSFVR